MIFPFSLLVFALPLALHEDETPLVTGQKYIQQMSGCFDTTYEFIELEPQPGEDSSYREHRYNFERHWIEALDQSDHQEAEAATYELRFWFQPGGRDEPSFHYGELWTYLESTADAASQWRQSVFVERRGQRVFGWTCDAPFINRARHCENIEAWKPQRHTRLRTEGRRDYDQFVRNHELLVLPNTVVMNQKNVILGERFDVEGESQLVEVNERDDVGVAIFKRVLDDKGRGISSKEECLELR